MRIVRSVFAVFAGLMLISVVAESVEFALVALVNGAVTTDPEVYFRVRNRPAVLAAKLVYNSVAAIAGGFVAAWLARRSPMAHGLALSVVQTAAFAWAVADPALRRFTPDWMWASLVVLTGAGIMAGSLLQQRRAARAGMAVQARSNAVQAG